MFDLSKLLSGGALGSGIFNLFGGHLGQDPSKAANQYLNRIPDYLKPYLDRAGQLDPQMQQLFSGLMSDPGAFLSKLSSGYQQSPGYQARLKEAMTGINAGQAAGGMAGSLQNQQLAGQKAADIASQDYQDYLKNVLGLFGQGISGGEHMSDQGMNAAGGMAGLLGQQGNMAYNQAAARNQQRSSGLSDIFGGLAGLFL